MTLNSQYTLYCSKDASCTTYCKNLNEDMHTISGKNVGQ